MYKRDNNNYILQAEIVIVEMFFFMPFKNYF